MEYNRKDEVIDGYVHKATRDDIMTLTKRLPDIGYNISNYYIS